MNQNKKQQVGTNNNKSPRSKLTNNIILRMKIQRMITVWKKMVKKSKHRINILKEWAITEQAYIKDLKLIIEKIQKPLLQANLLTSQQDRIIFPNLDAMLKLSQELLAQINDFLNKWHPNKTLIGEAIISFHKQYCNNFYKAQKIIKTVKQKPQCQKIQSSLPMDIQSYIIKPVQRPPKYQLLLREYQKALPQTHKDYKSLTEAISKYHFVNQENNQSMDLQIRNQKMIQLDKKYGNIINTTRVYLFEQSAKTIEFKAKMYAFNDLILIARVYGQNKQEGYKKIFINGQSFAQASMDGKYLVNKLFICGTKQNIHLLFQSQQTRNKANENIQKILHELYRKQTNRTNTRKRTKSKMKVMTVNQIQIKSKPMLRINVVGVQKRPLLNINIMFQTFYILKIQAPFPNNIFQYSYIKFDDLIQLQRQLKNKYKHITLPLLDDKPDDMSIYDVKKNKTKIIQCRQVYIQRFMNYVFRSQQLQNHIDLVNKALKINEDLWQFVQYNQPCNCDICADQKQVLSLQQFQNQKEQIKNLVTHPRTKTRNSHESESRTSLSSRSSSIVCVFNSFMMPKKMVQTPVLQLNSLKRRLTWLQCKLGRIDYSLIPKDEFLKNIKVTVHLLSIKQNQNINVKISPKTTVLQVIDQIADMYQIETMRDFGLFLDYQEVPRLLDRDQKLLQVLKDVDYEMDQSANKQKQKQGTSIWQKLGSLKKWGEQMITGKKPKLYIKKLLFVEESLQIKACQSNPQRYSLIVQQIFYRFKNELLILNMNDTKKLCALYYTLNNMQKLPYLTENNFQIDKIKLLLPQSRMQVISDSGQFQNDVYNLIKQYEKMMDDAPVQDTRRSNVSSAIFSKVQVVQAAVITLVNRVIGWNTMFFDVVNYDPATLPGACPDLLLGINRKNLLVIRKKQLQPLLQVQLMNLEYKVTVHSIFVETQQRTYRFDGKMMYDIKKLIQIYQLMGQKFKQSELPPQKKVKGN